MPIVKTIFALSVLLFTACSDDAPSGGDTPDAAVPTADAAPDAPPPMGNCSGGGDRLVLAGPITLDSSNFGPVTVEGKVAGFNGAVNTEIFMLTKRRMPLDGNYESIGVHDIGTEHVKFLMMPFMADCSTAAGMCHGFIALAGTVTVTAIAPRFLATFEFTDLYARTDQSNDLGAAIPGTITGCVNSRLDP